MVFPCGKRVCGGGGRGVSWVAAFFVDRFYAFFDFCIFSFWSRNHTVSGFNYLFFSLIKSSNQELSYASWFKRLIQACSQSASASQRLFGFWSRYRSVFAASCVSAVTHLIVFIVNWTFNPNSVFSTSIDFILKWFYKGFGWFDSTNCGVISVSLF